jgi:hypothetical protein
MLTHIVSAVMARFKRAIQYSRDLSAQTKPSGLLDRSVKPGDDTELLFEI